MSSNRPITQDAPHFYAASASGHLRIEREQRDDSVVLRLTGELDIESAAVLARVMREPATAAASRIVLDLSGVDFIDSTGISALVQARLQSGDESRQFVLTHLHRNVDRLLNIAGISSQFTIC